MYVYINVCNRILYYVIMSIYVYINILTFNVIQPALINYSFQAPPSWGQADFFWPLKRLRDLSK